MSKKIKIFPGIVLLILLTHCSEDQVKKSHLVSVELFASFGVNALKTFVESSGLDISSDVIKYSVEVYKVSYRTDYKGVAVIASGLIVLPQTSDPVSMVSFHHGTIVADEDAPSRAVTGDPVVFLYAAVGSSGFITVVPDLIGFGASNEIFHPYYVEEPTASAIIDNLFAARELGNKNDLIFNEKLFLAGYSQGGYATMAAHKAIEVEKTAGFNLIASFPAAGGYDVKAMQEHFFSVDNYHEPFYIAYVAQAYQENYDWSEPLSNFFNEPYATEIPFLFDGSKSGGQINLSLTTVISDLLNNDVLNNIDSDTKFSYLVDAFEANSLIDWTPEKLMYMYHGDADITVPFQNSVNTYDQLLKNGASPITIHFITLPGEDHGSGVLPYIEDFVPKMLELNK